MSSLRIVAGVQEPAPGSQRDRRMVRVKSWLLANPTGGMYWQVAAATGLSLNAVQTATLDIHLFDDDLIVSIPAPKNGYAVRLTWREVLYGEANQARHNATRLDRQAVRCRKVAGEYERQRDLSMAGWLRSAARSMEAQAAELRSLAEAMDK